jgi:hypothetical protein
MFAFIGVFLVTWIFILSEYFLPAESRPFQIGRLQEEENEGQKQGKDE